MSNLNAKTDLKQSGNNLSAAPNKKRPARNNAQYSALRNDAEAQQKILEMFDKCLNLSNSAIKNNGEIKLSIKEDALGKYVDVDTDQQIIEGKTLKESISIINKYMDKKFRGKVFPLSENSKAYIGHTGIDEYSHPARKNIKDDILFSKLKAGTELDNLLSVSVFDEHKEDNGHHPEAVGGWDYYTTVFKVGNNFYQGRVSIEIRQNGREFKDITKIKGISRTANLSEKSPVDTRNSFNNSISNTNENVKFSLKSVNESAYEKAINSNDLETAQYFVDKAAVKWGALTDKNGRPLKVYHGTTNQEEKSVWNNKTKTYDTNYKKFTVFKKQYDEQSGYFFNSNRDNAGGYGGNLYEVYLKMNKPLIIDCNNANYSSIAYKGQIKDTYEWAEYAQSNGYDGVIFKNISDGVGYGDLQNISDDYVVFNSSQIKSAEATTYDDNGNIIPLNKRFGFYQDIRYSIKEDDNYSYDTLISKPDMALTNITDGINYTSRGITRKDIINEAVNNAKTVGRENENGNAVIYVYDIAKEIIVPKKAIQHSLDRRIEVNGPVVTNIGNILKNSIRINELIPRGDNIEQSYVLIGAAKSQLNEPFIVSFVVIIVSFVVNEFTNEVKSIDVLYSVNAKTEPAGSLSPELSSQSDVSLTGSNISISDLLDYVNRYYPDILPEDVLRHYCYNARPDGVIGGSALYSLKEDVNTSVFENNEELNETANNMLDILRLRQLPCRRFHADLFTAPPVIKQFLQTVRKAAQQYE